MKTKKETERENISKNLKMLANSKGTGIFLISVVVALIGVQVITRMMKGNLNGIVYPTWRTVVGFILFGQLVPVLAWYLWVSCIKKDK